MTIVFTLAVISQAYGQADNAPRHGQTRLHGISFVAWDAHSGEWVKPARFWANYADRKGPSNLGQATAYPPYQKVRPGDVISIVTPDGVCLMEFYHQRWRRANDVWRWSPRFNNHSGCGTVHDYRRSLLNHHQ